MEDLGNLEATIIL